MTGISLYLVAPTLVETLGSWTSLQQIGLYWFPVMAVLQGASLACLWELQRLALRMRAWRPVIASQLAGNALAKVAPGGGAIGAALQYRMLVQAGVRQAEAVSALTAVNLLTFAIVLALPVFAIPTFIRGSVSRSLIEATVVGLLVFLLVAGVAAVCLALDGPLAWVGRTVQRARNRLRRGSPPTTGLPDRLLRERDRILATLGPRWKRAVLAAVGRWAFDYATLLAALAAVGSTPRGRARPARLLRGPDARPDTAHPGRAGLRRGRAHGDPRPSPGSGPATPCSPRSPTGCSPTGCRYRSASSASGCNVAMRPWQSDAPAEIVTPTGIRPKGFKGGCWARHCGQQAEWARRCCAPSRGASPT